MTALSHAQSALSELRASDAYRSLSVNKTTFPGTHVGKCERELLATITDLQPPAPPVVAWPEPPRGSLTGKSGGRSAFGFGDALGHDIGGYKLDGFTDYGISDMAWPPKDSTGTSHFHDLEISNVMRSPVSQSDGTAEAALWVGQKALVERVKIRDTIGCMGVWTGARCDGSILSDLDTDLTAGWAIGVYMEHITTNVILRRSRIKCKKPVTIEWAYKPGQPWYAKWMSPATQAAWPGREGSYNITIEDCVLDAGPGGTCIFADAGVFNVTIRRCTFIGQTAITYPDVAHRLDPKGVFDIDWASCDTSGLTGPREVVHQRAIG